jgi:N-acetylmuramoyl-L-alanine amidase
MMNYSIKKQILANTAFAIVLTAVLSAYCIFWSNYFNKAETIPVATDSSDKKCVVIDPGHGGEDGGAVGVNGVLEKDLNLSLSEILRTVLKFSGCEVILTRTEDKMLYDRNSDFAGKKKILDLKGRLEIANDISPDIFVGIHMNSFPEQKYLGLSIYYSPNTPESQKAAQLIRENIQRTIQPNNNREIKAADSNIYILDRTTCPAILIECGFLSNPEECEKLSTYEYQRNLSLVFYSSLVSFLEE